MSAQEKVSKKRSPEHPMIGLEEAIGRAQVLYNKEHFNYAHTASVLGHWGYSAKSGFGFRVLGALRHFGLLEGRGQGDSRQVRLSTRGKLLVLKDRGDPEWDAEVQKAALAPSIHKKLWELWGAASPLPSEDNMRWELETRQDFNRNAIDDFISTFRATLAYANLTEDDSLSDGPPGDPPAANVAERAIRVHHASSSSQEPKMQDGAAVTPAGSFTMPIPVPGGEAYLTVPRPMTQETFGLIVKSLKSGLALYKPSLVEGGSDPDPKEMEKGWPEESADEDDE